jgi:hypothetical protein
VGLGGNRVIICSILFTFGVISPPEAGKDKSVSVRYVELAIPSWRGLYGYNLRFGFDVNPEPLNGYSAFTANVLK